MMTFLLDLAEYLAQAALLLFFCKDSIILKEKYRSVGKVLFFLQAFLVSFWLSQSVWVDRLLYKDASGEMSNSSYSIVKLVIVFVCSFLAMDLIYQGRRLAKLYLLMVFYTVREMTRFVLHSVWSLLVSGCLNYISEQMLKQNIEAEEFYVWMQRIQWGGAALFSAGCLVFMYIVLWLYGRYRTGLAAELTSQGLWFLMLTPIIGMAFDVLWRITFFRRIGAEVEFLYDKHGSMYVVVPAIALLCLICTVFSRKIYSELMQSEEQKNNLLFYKQQLSDMTEHVRELEQLYDGIRGMRHDINNYVADMEQLMQVGAQSGQIPEQVRQEAGQYLQSMQRAASGLTMQFSTGNPVTDVILNRKGQICGQEQICMEGDLLYPDNLGIEVFDLGILLNNALDNAIEACRKIPVSDGRFICFRGYVKGKMFFLVIENTCNVNCVRVENGELRSTKENQRAHGLGMSNMRSCVEKYYGTMQYEMEKYEAEKSRFVLTIMLQGNG